MDQFPEKKYIYMHQIIWPLDMKCRNNTSFVRSSFFLSFRNSFLLLFFFVSLFTDVVVVFEVKLWTLVHHIIISFIVILRQSKLTELQIISMHTSRNLQLKFMTRRIFEPSSAIPYTLLAEISTVHVLQLVGRDTN